MRYLGPIHTLGLMWREEGMRGLYRGYTSYLMASAIFVAFVPIFAELSMAYSKIGGNYDDSADNMLYDYLGKKNKIA
jgi:hypothetical protein